MISAAAAVLQALKTFACAFIVGMIQMKCTQRQTERRANVSENVERPQQRPIHEK